MVQGLYHGNPVTYTDVWRYEETGEDVKAVPVKPCKHCGQLPTKEGYDACIGYLPGVVYACCGHGKENPYVVFKNGKYRKFENIDEMRGYFKKVNLIRKVG